MYMVHNPDVIHHFQAMIDAVNPGLARHERVQGFRLVHEPWTVENGLVTMSLKLRRVAIEQKYAKMINEMYR
ncbi:MAG: hypothetical protein R3330_14230, partial [Saprospiraceae bacterium]|nr:hypothetical protein [Saprospiraceae bacterium]